MKNFIWKIYSFCFFSDLVLIYPVYAVMFADKGLSPLQISVLLMVWAGTSFLLEVPSGVLADKYSRKNILIGAEIVRIIGYTFWLLMPTFTGFLIGFVLWGIKSAFTSGTLEALVYDELKASKRESRYIRVQGFIQSLQYLAFVFAGLGASLAITKGYSFVLVISIVALIIAVMSLMSLPQVKSSESTGEKNYFKLLVEGLKFSIKIPSVLKIIVFISLGQALFGALDEYWSIFASGVGLAKQGLGIFFVIYGLVQTLASSIAYRFEKISLKYFEFMFLVNGILLLLASYYFTIPALGFLFIFSFLFKVIDTVTNSRLQHQITNHKLRATITSVKGFFVELAVMGFYLGFGSIAKNYGYQQAFSSIGVLISVIGMSYLGLSKESKSTNHLETA